VQDAAPERLHQVQALPANASDEGAVLVGLELDDRRPWPPSLPTRVTDAGLLDSRASRQRLLEQLSHYPPARLLVACDPLRSPDRGSLALLAELARTAGDTRIWLLPAAPDLPVDPARLDDWHQALAQLGLPADSTSPLTWLEHGHD
jgi:hypothetical protein